MKKFLYVLCVVIIAQRFISCSEPKGPVDQSILVELSDDELAMVQNDKPNFLNGYKIIKYFNEGRIKTNEDSLKYRELTYKRALDFFVYYDSIDKSEVFFYSLKREWYSKNEIQIRKADSLVDLYKDSWLGERYKIPEDVYAYHMMRGSLISEFDREYYIGEVVKRHFDNDEFETFSEFAEKKKMKKFREYDSLNTDLYAEHLRYFLEKIDELD